MKKVIAVFCLSSISLSLSVFAASSIDLESAVECINSNVNCPGDAEGKREAYNIVISKVFRVVGSLDSSYTERAEAKQLAKKASNFLTHDILDKNGSKGKSEVYDIAMAKALQVVGSLDSTPKQREEAKQLAMEASNFLIAPILGQ